MNHSDHNYPLSSIFTDGFFRFLLFILLFISLLYQQKSLILISILLLVMFYGLKLWSTFSVKNIHYSFDAEKKKGFPGELVALQAVVSNNKFLPIWLKLKIPIDKKLNPSLDSSSADCLCEEGSLLWYDRSSWQWKLTARNRGCFQIGPPFLETGDLLGFFQQRKYLSQVFEPSSQRKTLLIIDVSTFQKKEDEDLFEKTLEVVAAMAMEFERQGSPYGLLSNGEIAGNGSASLSMATGSEQLSRAMELLARLQMKTAVSIEEILFKEDVMPGGTGCIYSSCTLNKKNTQIAQFLRQHHIPVYFMAARVPRRFIDHSIKFFLLDEIYGGDLDSNQDRTQTLNE